MKRYEVAGTGCNLSIVEFGDPGGKPMLLVHGMRDHAMSLSQVAEAFPGRRVVCPDMRGHGDSDNPGAYTMALFIADLKLLADQLALTRVDIVGHSLGGHICSRFSVLYPELVDKLVLIDGIGPPREIVEDAVGARIENWRSQIDTLLTLPGSQRAMADRQEALARLKRNNPKLSDELANIIVDEGVELVSGGVAWKWDPRVQSIWSTFDHDESELFYSRVTCPVLMISGDEGLAYWLRMRPQLEGQQAHYDREYERRERLFPNAEHVVLTGAGHMVHYDAPGELISTLAKFLND